MKGSGSRQKGRGGGNTGDVDDGKAVGDELELEGNWS